MIGRGFRLDRGVCLAVAAWLLIRQDPRAPMPIALALILTLGPLLRALRAARGTALGAAVVWGLIAVVLGTVAEGVALTESPRAGLPWAGHLTYLTTLATLAALISVLNARTPGGGAWAILMSLLVLVFLIPWLEAAGLRRAPVGLARLSLTSPWTIFYGLLVLAGVTNYLPTRFGPAVVWLALGLALEFFGLTRNDWAPAPRGALWIALPWTLAAAVLTAEIRARNRRDASNRLDRLWLWFRDHWGVVWALRVMERFNRSAALAGWPFRLTWHGLTPPGSDVPDAALLTLKTLLRRFARPERIDREAGETSKDGGS